ncbi:MAG: hypothetical protein IIZ14_06675 [Solobacterium sp.]|nr:hypothetical protein [Solobacterium sp.]MBR2727059.1 hypothetical protein [Solobacterium sp.]
MNIKQICFRKKCIEIHWEYHGTEYTSMLYRHSDYSWHPDADTRRMPPVMLEELQHQVWLRLSAGPKKKTERKKPADTWFADSR